MVLKRILVTALGALGLGALAAGTATAQQIPAPDIFDDQIACSMNVPGAMATPTPSVVPMGAMMSALDTLIGDGTPLIDTAGTGAGSYEELGYVIDPMVANCGGASVTPGDTTNTPDTTAFTAAANGAAPTDVAEGYTDLLTKFVAVYGDPGDNASTGLKGALDDANKALAMGIEDETTGAALTLLEEAVTRAEAAYNKALATFNAANMGPINQAGAAEWMAKAAVTKSVADYNTQVGKTNTALTTLNGTAYVEAPDPMTGAAGASKWVPLGNQELFDPNHADTVVTIAMGMGTVNLDKLIQYANGNLATPQVGTPGMAGMGTGDGSEGNDAAVASDVTASNFDAAGNLIIPMSVDSTNAAALVPTTSATNTIADIRTLVDNSRIAAAALKKAADENVGLNQAIYDEAYRRAQLEADYYAARWAEVLADNTDQRTTQQKLKYTDTNGDGVNDAAESVDTNLNNSGADAYVENPISIAARNSAYTEESNKRVIAETDLRAKVAAREAATAAVREAFTSPQGFYNQLVARRTALKAAADKVVADAGTPTAAQNTAAENAAKALMEAEEARDNLVGLFEDDMDPTVDLIGELLKADADGDDGGALVKAISSNYDTAKAANDKANEVAEDVAGLTGDEGAVSQNTANIKKNADDITKLDGRVAMNEAEIWDADGNSRIDANEMRSMANATAIMTNADNIATNATNIMGLRTDVDQNADDIMTNAGNIMTNSGRIDANEAAIMGNSGMIADNASAIGRNSGAITDNRNMIGELSEDLDVVRAGVAASMALAGMPAINGRGVSIGVGSFDGESAFAVGFQIQGEMASFKVGVTSASGATGASAGVGFQF